MNKSLVIAEKPSVAQDIARALTESSGKFTKQGDYFENDQYVIASAVGHLLEIHSPEEFDVKRGKWSFANLPVLPPHFDLKPIDKVKTKLNGLVKLIKRKDITNLINACDAGREGELIFRLILQHAGGKRGINKPVQRLWLQSMTPAAIKDGFQHLRSQSEVDGLADAARCRAEADWLIGINGTRAMTAFNSQEGGFFLTTVGRVQTPTLAIVVERELQIRNFKAQTYWEIVADFALDNGQYRGKWFDPNWKKTDQAPQQRANRLWDAAQVAAIVAAVKGKTAQVSEESKPQKQNCPPLFDLTSLQREANSRFGFSAKTTLSIAQSLYEKHKAITYPRTDSRALPEDYLAVVKQVMQNLATSDNDSAAFAQQAISDNLIRPSKAIFNNAKISDHFAIIPTSLVAGKLNEIEQKLYDFIVKRFIAVFFPAASYLLTTRISQVEQQHFKTEGKVLVSAGWQAIYGKKTTATADNDLPSLAGANQAAVAQVESQQLATKPPARFNEATLLGAMEGAGKLIENDELRSAMQDKGIGTPATRASIIEGLINEKYLMREQRDLIATTKAIQLLNLLKGLDIQELCSPQLTGDWEHQLALIEKHQTDRDSFMASIRQMTQSMVDKTKAHKNDTVPGDYATLTAACPNCGGLVKENYRRFSCSGTAATSPTGCGFSFSKLPSGRALSAEEAQRLLQDKTIGPFSDFRSKAGWPFSAKLVLKPDPELNNWKVEFDFPEKVSKELDGKDEPIINSTALGNCLKCTKGQVFETESVYICDQAKQNSSNCDFKINKVILQQVIDREQAGKLLKQQRSDLLENFVSQRTKRGFKAFLVWDKKTQKFNFEFEAKAKKTTAKAAKKA